MKPSVISALFYETSTYDDQYSSAFETHFDDEVSNRLLRATEDGRKLNSINLSRAVGDAISVQSRVGSKIIIPGGFGEKRLSFIITLLTSDAAGYTQRQVLTGYTDYSGVNLRTGSLDDEMELFINNSVIIRDTFYDTGRGRQRRSMIEGNEYIIRGKAGGRGRLFKDNPGDRLIRPYDIFNDHGMADTMNAGGGCDELVDTRADLGSEIKMGLRSDNNPSEYFSRVLRAGVTAETTEDRGWNSESHYAGETESRSEISAGMVNVSDIDENPAFMAFLQDCNFTQDGIITLRQMAKATDWPDKIQGKPVTQFIREPEMRDRGYSRYERGQGTSLRGAGNESVAARVIAQTIPAILMSHQIAEAEIKITNDTLDGKMNVVVYNERPVVPGQEVASKINAVEDLIRYQVADVISRRDEILVVADISIAVVTDIRIDLSMDNAESELYVFPMYCDGLLSPQKTDDHNAASKIANDIRGVIGNITDNLYREPNIDRGDGIRWDDGGRDNRHSRGNDTNLLFGNPRR